MQPSCSCVYSSRTVGVGHVHRRLSNTMSTVSGLSWSQRRNKRRNIYASVCMRRRHTVVVLSVCLSVTRISRRSLKTKCWYEHYMYIATFARTWIDRFFNMKLRFRVVLWFTHLDGHSWQSGLLWRQNGSQLGALQLVGSTGAITEYSKSAEFSWESLPTAISSLVWWHSGHTQLITCGHHLLGLTLHNCVNSCYFSCNTVHCLSVSPRFLKN